MAPMESSTVSAPYLDRPYHIVLVRDEGEDSAGWTAKVEELPGCEAHAETADEATRAIRDSMEAWIAEALANNREVPEPRGAASYSGRLMLRMPHSLHAELARAAERDDVSLNQFITSSLASSSAGASRTATRPPSRRQSRRAQQRQDARRLAQPSDGDQRCAARAGRHRGRGAARGRPQPGLLERGSGEAAGRGPTASP